MTGERHPGAFAKAALGLAVGLSIAVGLSRTGMTSHGQAVASSSRQTSGTLPAVAGVRFVGVHVAAGARPNLPDGSTGIPSSAAVKNAIVHAVAATRNGNLLPGISVSSQYGTFSDDQFGKGVPGGAVTPYYQVRPVWIVTLEGPGLVIPAMGKEGMSIDLPSKHEETVVIDAKDGTYLEGFS